MPGLEPEGATTATITSTSQMFRPVSSGTVRAVATRYDKRERIYQGTIDVASISIWLRDPVP